MGKSVRSTNEKINTKFIDTLLKYLWPNQAFFHKYNLNEANEKESLTFLQRFWGTFCWPDFFVVFSFFVFFVFFLFSFSFSFIFFLFSSFSLLLLRLQCFLQFFLQFFIPYKGVMKFLIYMIELLLCSSGSVCNLSDVDKVQRNTTKWKSWKRRQSFRKTPCLKQAAGWDEGIWWRRVRIREVAVASLISLALGAGATLDGNGRVAVTLWFKNMCIMS